MTTSSSSRATQVTARRTVLFLFAIAIVFQVGNVVGNSQPPIWDEVGHTRAANALLESAVAGDMPTAIRSSLRYGLVYPLWLAAIYAGAGENPLSARIAQTLVAVATLAFLYLGASEGYGKRAGMVTLAAGVLYLPFVSTAARLLSETLAIFWLALGLWLVARGLKSESGRALFFGGMAAACAGLTRPTLQLLFVALSVGIFVALWANKQDLRRSLFFAGGAALFVVPFLLFTQVVIGRGTLSGTVSPMEGIFVGNYVPDGGYPTDTRSFRFEYPQPEFEQLRREGRNPRDVDFARVTWQVATRDPVSFVLLQLRKLHDQWRSPFNDFQTGFGLPFALQEIYHALLVGTALVYALTSLRHQPVTCVLVFGWLYVVATNLLVPVERRYAFPGVPFVLLLAGAAIAEWIGLANGNRRWLAPMGLAALSLAGMLLAFPKLQIGEWFISLPTPYRVLLFGLGAAGLAISLARFDARMRISALLVCLVTIFLFSIYQLTNPAVTEVRVENPAGIVQTIELPADSVTRELSSAEVYIDAIGLDVSSVSVSRGERPLHLRPLENHVFKDEIYAALLERRGRMPNEERQWYRFELDPHELEPNDELRISVPGRVVLTQGTPTTGSTILLPALDSGELNNNTSLYKYLADDDMRIPRAIIPTVTSGSQDWRYRMLLVLTSSDGTQEIIW